MTVSPAKNTVTVKPWSAAPESAEAFLAARYETSLFLLGNKEEHGVFLGEKPNSGHFQLAFCGDEATPRAVFCLTRRGNLLVQGDADAGLAAAIGQAARSEGRKINGVLGPWPLAAAAWDFLQAAGAVETPQFRSEEVLYRLQQLGSEPTKTSGFTVRLAREDDFEHWLPARIAFLAGEGLPHLTAEDLRANFQMFVRDEWLWLAIADGGNLAGMAGLNAKVKDIGQVGSVYTAPVMRQRGVAEAIMRHMFADVKSRHGISRLILFTGREEQSAAARRLYERLGFERCGSFGLIFG